MNQTNVYSYSQFCENYSSEGWLARKAFSPLVVLWSGIVKPIYHLALAILVGLPKAMIDQGTTFKDEIECTKSDLSYGFAHLITIFHDRYGLYLIGKGQFHFRSQPISLKNYEL